MNYKLPIDQIAKYEVKLFGGKGNQNLLTVSYNNTEYDIIHKEPDRTNCKNCGARLPVSKVCEYCGTINI